MENKDKRWLHIKNNKTGTETLISSITHEELIKLFKLFLETHEEIVFSWGGYDEAGVKFSHFDNSTP